MEIWDLNLRHMRAAVAIRDLGSISKAAEAANLSQPALTQGISKLERQLQAPLFERLPGGMQVSEAGAQFLPRAEAALARISSPRVTMTQIKALIALADGGSYARAAQMTGLSQPSLHRSVADLSLAVRQSLVVRRGRGIAFTVKGKLAVREARLARVELEAGLAELAALAGREVRTIRIGAMPLSRARILPAAISAHVRRHQGVGVSVMEGAFHELIEPLRDGEIDMMVGALRDPLLDPDIKQQELFQDRPSILGRSGHPALAGSCSLDELAVYPWIMPANDTPIRMQWRAMFEAHKLALPDVPVESGSPLLIRQILLDSDFLTLLSPDQLAAELEEGRIVEIAQAPPGLIRKIGCFSRADWLPTPLQLGFVQLLKEAAAKI
jgi:LysR family transcriptional regulator, regulator for genes of the gallate degradation pathway